MNDFWYGLSTGRKVGLVVGVLAIVAIVMALLMWVIRANYAVLFSDLNDTDAAKIVQQLDALKVGYRLADQGSAILVEEGQVHETRLKLTSSGILIKGGVGFELFDNAEYGMTDFAQKINYQRALQGELSRTIASLAKIKIARVHLVLPESSLFRKKDQQPSAALSLVLESGASLDESEVRGVQHLVAASVQNLEAGNIVIVDQNGATLTSSRSKNAQMVETRLDEKLRIEAYLIEKVRSLVENVFGTGNGVVNVDVTLNYDQIQRRIEQELPTLDADGKPMVSHSSRTKSVKPGLTAISSDGGRPANTETNAVNEISEQEFRFGKSVEEQVLEIGKVSRLTISVMVPDSASEAQIEQLERLVTASVGLNFVRGDLLEISAVAGSLFNIVPDGLPKDATATPTSDLNSDLKEDSRRPSTVIGGYTDTYIKLGPLRLKSDYLIYSLTTLVVLVIALSLGLIRRKQSLSHEQRQELLSEIRVWLNNGDEEESRVG